MYILVLISAFNYYSGDLSVKTVTWISVATLTSKILVMLKYFIHFGYFDLLFSVLCSATVSIVSVEFMLTNVGIN